MFKKKLFPDKLFVASSLSAINKCLGIALEFALNITLARVLGAEQYGLYAYTIVLVTAIATVSTLGYDTTSLRFIPEYKAKKKWGLLHGFLRISFFHTFVVSIIASCCILLSNIFLKQYNNDIQQLLILSLPLLPILSLSRIRQFVLRAFKYTVRAEILDIVARPLAFCLVLLIFNYFASTTPTSSTAILINIPITLVSFLTGMFWLYNRIPPQKKITKLQYNRHQWLMVSLPLLSMTILQLISGYSDTIMLGLLENYTASGIYSIAARISSFASFSLLTINMILAPMISELFFLKNYSELQRNITNATRVASAISFFTCIFLLCYGKIILNIFGSDFSEGYLPLLILLPGQLLNSCCGSVGLILSLTGHHKYTAKILAITSLLNIFLNYILIPSYGMAGAAASTTVSISGWNILMAISVNKKLKIQPTILRVNHVNKT